MSVTGLRTALREAASKFDAAQTRALLTHPTVLMTAEAAWAEGPVESVEALIGIAAEHGQDSEPEMEEGDLEAFLDAANEIAAG